MKKYFKIKYFLFLKISLFALFLAYRAGEKALFHKNMNAEQKLFKSLPELRKGFGGVDLQTGVENFKLKLQPTPTQSKKKSSKPTQKKSKDKVLENNPLPSASSSMKEAPRTPISLEGDAYSFLKFDQKHATRNVTERKKNIPSFSQVYLPVMDTGTELLVIEGVTESPQGKQYNIQQYDSTGTVLQSEFMTVPGAPFQTLPKFVSVSEKQFMQSSNFFAFDDETETQGVLAYVPLVESILETASDLDSQESLFLGKDATANFNVYQLYPGIYSARLILP
ncbi:MAG: hypothetical protein HY390_05030 [Deltaproteobacteria bacterium]|nr:hypothetical protein [Deltaproteobacteria bacterium]